VTSIHPVHERSTFTLEKAVELVPLLLRITRQAHESVEALLAQLPSAGPELKTQLDRDAREQFFRWVEKVQRLGGVAKGMWLVDFDNGTGFLCWKYPETEITHFHGYDQGFAQRTKLH
jgi:hypothetical protein